MKKIFRVCIALLLCFSLVTPAFALDGIWHNPYGIDDLYDHEPTEIYPLTPIAGEMIYIKSTTWPIEPGQSVWLTYTKNGEPQQDVGAEWKYNDGNNSYWEAAIGPFAQGDVIEYTVYADKDGQNTQSIGPFSFHVVEWESAQSVELGSQEEGLVVLNVTPDQGDSTPKLGLSFPSADVLRFQFSPLGDVAFEAGAADYSIEEDSNSIIISTSALEVTVTKSPYGVEVRDLDTGKLLTQNGGTGSELSWLTDGAGLVKNFRGRYESPSSEKFYGFGERYNGIEKRGETVDIYVYNQYQNQGERSYLAVPFFYSSKGYGLYLDSTYYAQFDMADSDPNQYTFTVNTSGDDPVLDYYIISGTPEEVIGGYSELSGKPQDMPKWAFGLWMSANEWDRQSEVLSAVENAEAYDIPASVVVLEQWSDENTFYIFNDSTYTARPGGEAFSGSDFTYSEKWPDPASMVDTIHDNGMKVLLWQIPVLKYTDYAWEQKDNDEAYMIEQGYAVGDGEGGQYRIPSSGWFGNSLLLDFTNPDAVDWWMSKRAYLFDDIGIDGFKTDGGEMVWGRNTSFYDGSDGLEMRNEYPNAYIEAYYDFTEENTGTGMTFSRAGTAGVQSTGVFWAGDQSSTFDALQDSISAGLSAGISGIPFWGWDLAGFTGDFPTAELYKRSTQAAAFAPIMQFHSEKANPSPSEERSPWNVQERTGDDTIIPTFRYYVNTRMNILPYIYREAQQCTEDGTPLMRAMMIDFPEDPEAYDLEEQYMFGRSLLVAPVLEEGQTVKEIYLPEGEWIDFFHNALTAGGGTKNYYCDVDSIPVYVRNGSIIPLNLNEDYELGGSIGNDVDNYTNLTFRVYPKGDSSYTLVHSDRSTITVNASEDFKNGSVSVSIPAAAIPVTTQVFGTEPTGVTVNGQAIQRAATLDEFQAAQTAYYYSGSEKLVYIKTAAGDASEIEIEGIYQAPYEAEHAEQANVAVNTDHEGYYGEGFVDQFASEGCAVTFTVNSDGDTALLDVRYSAGTEAAQRTLLVNGESIVLDLPKTQDWDSWNTVSVPVELVSGQNTITISYQAGNFAGINLDCISLRNQ